MSPYLIPFSSMFRQPLLAAPRVHSPYVWNSKVNQHQVGLSSPKEAQWSSAIVFLCKAEPAPGRVVLCWAHSFPKHLSEVWKLILKIMLCLDIIKNLLCLLIFKLLLQTWDQWLGLLSSLWEKVAKQVNSNLWSLVWSSKFSELWARGILFYVACPQITVTCCHHCTSCYHRHCRTCCHPEEPNMFFFCITIQINLCDNF